MNAETQLEQPTTPETTPKKPRKLRFDSEKSKPQRGGRRPGAGRKPNYVKHLLSGMKPITAAETLVGFDVIALVHDLLKNGSRPVKLQCLSMLWDRIYGRPKQEIGVSGGLVHAHTRDPLLASLPKEALEALARAYDDVLAKYALNAAQDGRENHTFSKPAIDAGEVIPE